MKSYAHDGPVVIVPARVAFHLWRKLGLDNFRTEAAVLDQELFSVLQSWHGVAVGYEVAATKGRREIPGRSVARPAEVAGSCGQNLLRTSQVADLAHITERAVRLAADDERLKGTKDEAGAWTFERGDVTEWLSTRTRRTQ